MGRRPLGTRAMTGSERRQRHEARKAEELARLKAAASAGPAAAGPKPAAPAAPPAAEASFTDTFDDDNPVAEAQRRLIKQLGKNPEWIVHWLIGKLGPDVARRVHRVWSRTLDSGAA